MALPLDTPLIMQSASMNGCNDLYPTKSPVFLRDDDFKAKVVVLHSVAEGLLVIRSASDGDELIVGANGGCYFESSVLGIGEQFKVEAIANGSVVFVSCRTGHVLDTDDTGLPRCVDTIRRGWFLLQHDLAHKVSQNPAMEAAPVMGLECGHCRDYEAKERREYIMKLVSLGKSLEEVDAILLRMYAWPTAEKVIVAGGGGGGAMATEKQAPPPNVNSAAWQWMKPE